MLTGDELLEVIRELAAGTGLELAAAVPLRLLEDDRFDEWLARGYDGEMSYLARHRLLRSRPAEGFAPCRSAVIFLVPYDDVPPAADPGVGNIARYALGDDYHDVIKKKLFAIIDALRERDGEIQARALVDTAPLLEKVAAARAGLGWQGKHTNLLREDRGSWFFLAEILIDRDLPEPAAPAVDRCGICTACIDVCPTRAIVAPYVLDARLCISYLTIELRGVIPRELRGSIGNRIFGCDDCQEVCPWNRFARESPVRELAARPGLRERTLAEWMDMGIEEWRATFRGSAVKRAKYEGFQRNVAVALGNTGDEAAVEPLGRALGRESALIRAHAVWALRQIGGERAEHLLRSHLAVERALLVQDEITADRAP